MIVPWSWPMAVTVQKPTMSAEEARNYTEEVGRRAAAAAYASIEIAPTVANSRDELARMGIEVPAGLNGMQEWGRTIAAFGQKVRGWTYKDIYEHASLASYLKWVRPRKSAAGPLGDFREYVLSRDILSKGQKDNGSQDMLYPGTTVTRVLAPDVESTN